MITFKSFLAERTMNSAEPELIITALKKKVMPLFTHEHYDMSDAKNVMDFAEWQLAKFERDFGAAAKTTEPKRVKLEGHDVINLLVELAGEDPHHMARDERAHVAEGWLAKFLKPYGWFVFSMSGRAIYLDPVKQQPVMVPAKLYHFSMLENKDSILRKGLLPKSGQYEDDYKYPPRIHALTVFDKSEMFNLAMHIFNHGRSNIDVYYNGADPVPPLVIFEIDVAKCNKGTKFYEDISVAHGVWTYTHIPATALKVVYEDKEEQE